jgi:glycosyltransferase involved in cell wall biosynthesis
MRVLIDASSLLVRSAGVKNYTYHWIQHLRQHSRNEQILAFPYLNSLGTLTHDRSMLPPAATYTRLGLLYFLNMPWNPLLDRMVSGTDVFHVSNLVRNVPRKPKITATIHDMTRWLMPELHTPATQQADDSFAEQVLRRADRLIAVSENTRRDAIRILKLDPAKIEVIHSGVPEVFFGAQARPSRRPYVLFVGTIEPRKNIDMLLDAWQSLRLRDDFDLLIAGPPGWSAEKTIARLRAGVPDVKYLGYVPEDELPGLTAGATAFVYPSLYEGFGFPVAQAMAAGVPVITSNTSCLPEIAGEGAVYIDPRSAGDLRAALENILTSPALRERLSKAGAERAQQYRWDACAQKSLEFFRRARS